MEIFWYLPTQGDERYLETRTGKRQVTPTYTHQIAQAIEQLGYDGMLLDASQKQDIWSVATSLIPVTDRLRFLVAIRPAIMSVSALVRMAATFDRISNGRLLLNIVTRGEREQLTKSNIFLNAEEGYKMTDEFLTIWRSLMSGDEVNFNGQHLRIKGGRLTFPPVQRPYPPLYFGGTSAAAMHVAAKHADLYLTWGKPPQEVAQKIAKVRRLAVENRRTVRFGIRLHVIVRETQQQAQQAAEELTQSLKTIPNLRPNIDLMRRRPGMLLVGNPQTVAKRMQEYADLGIDTFILSSYPHLEEAYRLAQLLFHLLPLKKAPSSFIQSYLEYLG